jgi:HlyD family secretion protein
VRRIVILLLILFALAALVYYYLLPYRHAEREYIILYGNVDVRQVDIGFRVNGRVIAMPFEEGDLVPAGTLMATLDPQPYADKVLQAEATRNSAKISLDNALLQLNRRQNLVDIGGVAQEDLDNSLTSHEVAQANYREAVAALGVAQTNLREIEVFAPTEGTILTRIREPGSVVKEADPVYTLSILSPIWIRAFVTEPDLPLIYPGMVADVYTDTDGIGPYRGHIGFISPIAEFTPKTVETTQLRTDLVYRLRVIVDNPDRALRQGMPVTVHLSLKDNGSEARE